MLLNTEDYLCKLTQKKIRSLTKQIYLNSTPFNITRKSPNSFLICDYSQSQNMTEITQLNTLGQTNVIMQIDQTSERWDAFDDYVLIVTKQGDIVYANLDNKSIDIVRKQHPGHFITVLHTENDFITCGGYVNSLSGDTSQRIVKIWGIDNDDKLECKSRFNTQHTKIIQSAFLLNKTNLVTLSQDKSIKIFDIGYQCLLRNINTGQMQPISGCQIDYNTIIYGGNKPNLQIIDKRTGKNMNSGIQLNQQLIHITKIIRFSDQQLMVANINHLLLLDMRKFKIIQKQKVQGETTWSIKVLNKNEFVIGNRDKFVQVWEAL